MRLRVLAFFNAAFTYACTALSFSGVRVDIGVLRREFVTSPAVRSERVMDWRRVPAKKVLTMGDCFQVRWVKARGCAAKMVDLQAGGDLAVNHLVANAMGVGDFPVCSEVPIPR